VKLDFALKNLTLAFSDRPSSLRAPRNRLLPQFFSGKSSIRGVLFVTAHLLEFL
jgi:hypothetical protein